MQRYINELFILGLAQFLCPVLVLKLVVGIIFTMTLGSRDCFKK